jgi:predicted NAD/FAD-binding protein
MRIAIVGSGVSGLAATWVRLTRLWRRASHLNVFDRPFQALNEFSDHEVNLYEAGDYVGGHTHTVTFERGSCGAVAELPPAVSLT